MKVVVAISGASGAILALTLLKNLNKEDVVLIASNNAEKILQSETGTKLEELSSYASRIYANDRMDVDIASGTYNFDAMVIVPCSTSTLAKIACGIGDNLITRVASIALKEHRKLIIVPRETPLSTVTLKRMYELSSYGAVILPPVPAFYLGQRTVEDISNYIAGKILDQLGIEHNLYAPYSP